MSNILIPMNSCFNAKVEMSQMPDSSVNVSLFLMIFSAPLRGVLSAGSGQATSVMKPWGHDLSLDAVRQSRDPDLADNAVQVI